MRSAQVAPGPTLVVARINLSTLSIIFSLLLSLNIALTVRIPNSAIGTHFIQPLKAYIVEPFPWQIDPPPAILRNDSITWEIKQSYFINYFETGYNLSTMHGDMSIVVNRTTNLLTNAVQWPQTSIDCLTLMTQFLGGVFYSAETQDALCSFFQGSQNQSKLAQCYEPHICSINLGIVCTWTKLHVQANTPLMPQQAKMYVGFRGASTPLYLSLKLCYRLLLSMYILFYMWTRYYKHYIELASQCRKLTNTSRCYIIVGDPTSIVLLSPVVCISLVLDIWLSTECFVTEMLDVISFATWPRFLLGCFYLSRTVWFCYSTLSITSFVLKRWHLESHFNSVDPTIVAISAVIVAGPFTHLLAHSTFASVFSWLLNAAAGSHHHIESSLGIILYVSLIGILPIIYGFTHFFISQKCYHTSISIQYHSFQYNDIKHRLLFGIEAFFLGVSHVNRGSIQKSLNEYPAFKRSPCLSQRGADCYVITYNLSGEAGDILRLTLLHCMDLKNPPPNCVVKSRKGTCPFGTFEIKKVKDGALVCELTSSRSPNCIWFE